MVSRQLASLQRMLHPTDRYATRESARIVTDKQENPHLPGNFVDALLAYAIDPTQWESVVSVLVSQDEVLKTIDPSEFLSALSKAEALAWELQKSPQRQLPPQTGLLSFDAKGALLAVHGNAPGFETFYTHDTERQQFSFTNPASLTNVQSAVKDIHSGVPHALVPLADMERNMRFGYLVEATELPAGFQSLLLDPGEPARNAEANEATRLPPFILLVPQAQPTDEARRVLQTSFNLTVAETAVCGRLAAGEQLKEVAYNLGISANTARNHLQSVFEKTGLNRQNDLLLLMTQLNILVSTVHDQHDYRPDNSNEGGESANTEPDSTYTPPSHQFVIVARQDAPRRVAFRTYGNGAHTVVYFHESVSCSRLLPGTEEIANKLDLRIIATERPGAGFSDANAGFDFSSIARDTVELMDDLDIARASFIGYLSGGAYAISTAALIGDRASSLMLVAARPPSSYDTSGDHPLAVLRRKLSQQPWLLSTFFNILRNRANTATNRNLLMKIYGGVAEDHAYLEQHPQVLEHMVATSLESLTVSAAGIVGEITCYTNPTAVDVAQIACPVDIWHGEADVITKMDTLTQHFSGEHVAQRSFPGWGSMIIYADWEEILAQVASRCVA